MQDILYIFLKKNPRKFPGKFLLQPSQKPYLRYNVSLSVLAIFLVEGAVTWLPVSLCKGGQRLRLSPGPWVEEEEEEEAGKRTPYNRIGCLLSSVVDVGAGGEGVLRGGGGGGGAGARAEWHHSKSCPLVKDPGNSKVQPFW